jgi:signal transduction histidine kinase
VLAILLELGLDQVVGVAPWLIVPFALGLVAAILGGLLGGALAAAIGVIAHVDLIPTWVPGVDLTVGSTWEIEVLTAAVAFAGGLWIRDLILHPPERMNRRMSRSAADEDDAEAEPADRDVELVSKAVRDLGVARTPAQVADALARHVVALGVADGAVVYLARDGSDGYVALGRHGIVDPRAPDRIPSLVQTDRVEREADVARDFLPGEIGADAPAGSRTVELTIASSSSTFGILHLVGMSGSDRRPRLLVEVVSQVAADALERGRLQAIHRAAVTDGAGAMGRVATLARLAAELVGAMKVDEVARILVDLAVDDLAAGFAVLHVPDQASGTFGLVHARGYPAGLLAAERTIPLDVELPVTKAALDRTIVEIVGEDGWRATFPTASNVPAITGVRAITAIPMQVGGAVNGVLTIGWRTQADRARADRDLLTSAADQGAQGLERATLHANDDDARRFQEAFIGVVSHELRTPITTILAGSRLLRRRLDGASRAAELSEDIEAEADRLTRIVDDLLVLSRLERRHLTTGDEPVHLDHLLARVIRSESIRWPEHRIEINASPGSHVVVGDETYVEQVARNLLSNAAKYSPRGSLVEIAIDEASTGDVRVRVLDEGPGVLPSEVGELFSLFYRSPTTAASAAGAGIGLFVSRRLVAEMGGAMWARPRPDGGSEFGFSLSRYPIDEGEMDDGMDGPGGTASAASAGSATGSPAESAT